ncbi:MAG TPA: tautomerase family protein [Casimicrobiaceae bacterium]|nr:tautomerase family protein [Casimicrobiaceae bacterium]
MPHVIVKMWPGPSEQQKRRLAQQILEDVVTTLKSADDSVSIAIEEVKSSDWLEKVYRPEIEPRMDKLYKKPGYGPADL